MECYRHPDRDGSFYCQKDANYMCEECACCRSPRVYCQFRTACLINLLTREGELSACGDKELNMEAVEDVEKSVVTG